MKMNEIKVELMQNSCLASGSVYIAKNGMSVVNTSAKRLTTHKNGRALTQVFDKPISTSWQQRRVDAFAEAVAAMPLRKVRATTKKAAPKEESKSVQKRKAVQKKGKKGIRLKKEIA